MVARLEPAVHPNSDQPLTEAEKHLEGSFAEVAQEIRLVSWQRARAGNMQDPLRRVAC